MSEDEAIWSYPTMTALLEGEREGVDYEIETIERDSPVAVLAVHGGAIEPGDGRPGPGRGRRGV